MLKSPEFKSFRTIGKHRRKRKGEEATAPPHGSYPGKSGTYPGKFENIRANLKMKTFF